MIVRPTVGAPHILSFYQYTPSDIGSRPVGVAQLLGAQRLPNEPIGLFNLTMTNVVTGSKWRVEELDGTLRQAGVAASATVTVALDVYGSAGRNTLVIKIRNASGEPFYRAYETQVTAASGAQSIFINQERDDQ